PRVVPAQRGRAGRERGTEGGRPDSNLEGVQPAVEQPDGDIASLVVGSEDVFTARVPQLWADRDTAGVELAPDEASLRDDLDLLAVPHERLAQMVVVGAGLGDVMGVGARQRAQDDDDDEEGEEAQCDVVPPEPSPGQEPRALAFDRTTLFPGKLCRGVEGEFGRGLSRQLRLLSSPTPSRPGGRAPVKLELSLPRTSTSYSSIRSPS